MKQLVFLICTALCIVAGRSAERTTPPISLSDFRLTGDLTNGQADFTLTATVRVESREGGAVELLSGPVALTEVAANPRWTLRPEQNRFVAVFDRRGTFPIRLRFTAAVQKEEGWRRVEFRVAPTALQPVTLMGLPVDTEFDFRGAARPERSGTAFRSYLPPDGTVSLAWKETRPEGEGKLFHSAEMLSQIIVSPGLVRQVALFNFKVMQGELSRIAVLLRGEGEVTRVQGEHILAWNLEPLADPKTKRLVVQFNQPQKDQFTLQVQLQTALGAFPQASDVIGLRPEAASRFAGFFRIVNEGAVSLEVLKASGLTQISPEQFPESDASRAAFRSTGNQRFAYRFSGEDFALRIQADQIVPEVSVSELLAYRLGENELAIDSELELEIREAPLRELLVHIPKNYAVARVNAAGLADYFLTEPEDKGEADLRLVFGQPITGREIVELRLERNKPLGETTWTLPRVEVGKAKSVRGHIAVAAEAGFRISPERTQALTEIATAFFPRKVPGIQAAFRLSDATWLATMRVERLPQTVQADGLHLFSIGEGIAYGSSLVNYVISGAPISAFKIQLSKEYFNVEFTGKDVRNWQRTEDGYLVQLHTPVSGAYTLLATYERPFKAQGDTLTFTGARPADAQSEQGHTLIVSAYQFQVRPVEISPGLLPLEPGEVPSEYRLFFDAPILAAYRYVAQPFNLKLALNPLVQGDSLNQVVDRAVLSTRISKEGQILTDVHYFIKSRGSPHFRLTLPTGTELWSATVNGAAVVPVADAGANLVPLPQGLDPNAVINLELQLAAKASEAERVRVSAPITGTPVMLTDWKLEPDTGQRLVYRAGSLQPTGGVLDSSGFAQIARMFKGEEPWGALLLFVATPGLVLGALIVWRRTRVAIGSGSGTRDWAGGIVGILFMLFAAVCFAYLLGMASRGKVYAPRDLSFVAPIQQAGSIQVIDVANMPEEAVLRETLRHVWPGLLALPLWVFGWVSSVRAVKRMSWIAGWAFLAWAALRSPNGAVAFLILSGSFVTIHAIIPALMQLLRARPEPLPALPIEPLGGASSAATALLIGGLVWISASTGTRAASSTGPEVSSQRTEPVVASATVELSAATIAESVMQDVRVESGFVFAKANIRWRAEKGQALPVLFEPGVLTGINYPTNALRLMQAVVPRVRLEGSAATNLARAQVLTAQRRGVYDIEIRYELQLRPRGPETGFESPTGYGLVNRLDMTVRNAEVDIFSPQAVSVSRAESNTNTVARLVLSPGTDAWIGWRPRARDVTREKTTFYAEVSQLYVPAAGVIDGAHYVSIRPAQGELHELTLDVPSGVSITDVSDVATNQPPTEAKVPIGNTGLVSLWRFDPDARKLRITLGAAQSHPFAFLVRSQSATGGLPLEHSVGLVSVDGAADQIGLLAIATGSEVQLDSVSFEGLSPINLEDFPAELTTRLQSQFGGLAVRRAFRYANLKASASLKASAVEPDVRVESQDTLSLGEDRTVLAANASVEITRAGIFRMSFEMPAGYEVESISGSALSHWTEMKSESGRTITLHLNGKTEGKQQFAITLAGVGVKATNSWPVPQLVFREATKQRGTLLIVPEQGLRLQAGASEGLTQLDPQKSGIKQKGVLAFRALQTPHSLALYIERVDPWIQVTSLQQSTLTEAQIRVAANLQYQIENTGLKSFRVLIPTNAEAVRFEGEQVADFVADPASITNGLAAWNITLHRRVIGQYLLQASYQVSLAGTAAQAVIRGIQALDVNAQRGFLTVRSAGRLQVALDSLPSALQPAEWQSIPRTLQQGLPAGAASFSYRLVDATFQLPLKIERHEATKLLPARVNSISLNSVISDDGIMLTQVRLEMLPGDKRLLNLTLPKDARFWFAFVNRNGIWPWREQDRILIPLEQESGGEKAMPVELFYSCRVGSASSRELNLDLLAPKFDLPLENLTWRVSLDRKWKIKKWSGSFQLQQEDIVVPVAGVDLERYLQSEVAQQREQTKAAEDLLATGNSALAQGAPQQARRAFKAAYELSGHDSAFNEDARVQLHNVKLQQALIGLNVRQAGSGGEGGTLAAKLRDLRGRKELSYTQQDAKDIIDRNSADENAAYMRLAERLIQQQDAAVSSPTALRASIPDQGRVLTFKRAVVVDPWADLKITLIASGTRAAGWGLRALILLCTCGVFLTFGWIGLRSSQTPSAN